MKKALITGITGQDASYLSELLLAKGYSVHGMMRRAATESTDNIKHLIGQPHFHLHYGDLDTENRMSLLIHDLQPDEIYNLGGQSDVGISFEIPEYTGSATGLGVTRMLEAIRGFSPHSKLYHASTSELFGNATPPQNERTPMVVCSPYAAAKLYAHYMVRVYRESYGMFACSGILYNHESPRRGYNFVTRKVSRAAARIKLGLQDNLVLGNMAAKRDWGFAGDYVEAMWLMLQMGRPDDYVVGTGETHSVQEFVEAAFQHLELDWTRYVECNDASCSRPTDVNWLQADAARANNILGWHPRVKFPELVAMMVDYDLQQEAQCNILKTATA